MGKISMIIMANSTSGMIAFVVKKASDQEACDRVASFPTDLSF
tara:strand:+ start:328 stop:456 length:129 start_codon:yes stop_codon:yes gene_type:complete